MRRTAPMLILGVFWFLAAALAPARGELSAQAGGKTILENVKRVVVLGDSITYAGQYVDYLDAYLVTRFPERRIELLDLGLPSENVSGLTEPGHAGGKFPRPDLHERLARVLEKSKPDLVIACYGMNDGIYYPLNDERFQKFQDGIRRLVEAVTAARSRILLLTPPTFDPVPLKGKTLPAGLDEYRKPFEGYDQVLARYSQWLLEQRSKGWTVVDLHGPMSEHLAARRKETPAYILAGDGVHANATGHWLFTQQLLLAWGAPAEVDAAVIDAKTMKAERGEVSNLAADGGALRFSWRTRRPMPMDPKWDADAVRLERIVERFNQHRLTVTGAPAARYKFYEGDTLLATVTREELAAGLDLLRFADLSTNTRGPELFKLIHKRGRLLADAYLTAAGHKRPGIAKGLPLDEATQQAAELDRQLRELAAPVTLKLRLAPAEG